MDPVKKKKVNNTLRPALALSISRSWVWVCGCGCGCVCVCVCIVCVCVYCVCVFATALMACDLVGTCMPLDLTHIACLEALSRHALGLMLEAYSRPNASRPTLGMLQASYLEARHAVGLMPIACR